MSKIRVFPVKGEQIQAYIPALAQLRINIFREYPYLYDGDLAYEEKYLQRYVDSARSVIIIASDANRIIGASTALPLADETDAFRQPFVQLHYDIDRLFYFGESILEKSFRGQGIGVDFFKQREAHAAQCGNFDYYCFCAVHRAPDHPARPADYGTLDEFWQHRGYKKHPELFTHFSWKEINHAAESNHKMEFWLKTVNINESQA